MKNVLIAALGLLLLGSLAGNYLEYQRHSSRRPIVRYDGGVITRKDFQDHLESQFGKQVLNKLVYERLIHEAAAKAGVAATEAEIDARIAETDRRNSQLLNEARTNPTVMASLRSDLAQDISFENLRIKNVTVSDAEVGAFYQKNPALFTLQQQVEATVVAARTDVDAASAKGMLQQGMTGKQIARQPRLSVVGVANFALPSNLSPELKGRITQLLSHLADGQVGTVPVGENFLVIRANHHNRAGVPPLAEIKPLVTRLCRLQKAISSDVFLAQLYRDAHVEFEVDTYAPYFSDIQSAVDKLRVASLPTPAAAPPKP